MMKETAYKYLSWLFLSPLVSLLSWRRPWIWLIIPVVLYHLALAVIVPMVIKNQLHHIVVDQLKLNLEVDHISVDPYQFILQIDKIKISGQDLEQPLGFDRLLVDLQLFDTLQGVWTFKEIHLTGVYGEFNRINEATNNFTGIINNWNNSEFGKTDQTETTDSSPLKLQIEDALVQISQFSIIDQTRKEPFKSDLGPIDFHIQHLSSLPNTTGQQSLTMKTSRGVELNWNGSLSLVPFSSRGDVTLTGPLLTALTDYLKDEIDVAVATDNLQATFHYIIQKPEGADVSVQLSAIETAIDQIKVDQRSNKKTLIALASITLSDGEFKWPEASIHLPNINLKTGDLWITAKDGKTNWEQLLIQSENDDSESTPWHFINQILSVTDINLHYLDESSSNAAPVKVEKISLNVKNLSNQPHQLIEVAAKFQLQQGKFESATKLQINPLENVEGTYKFSELPLKAAQSFVDDYAKVNITGGILASEGKITSKNGAIKIQGNAEIDQFNLQEQSSQKTILSWSQLRLNRIIADVNEKQINIGRMRFEKAFSDFSIFPDGTHTLARVLITPERAATEYTDTSPDFHYLIGRIDFDDASGTFTDSSLPLPFFADVAKINGTISTLDSTSHTPANVKLEGQVSDYGEMIMTGAIFPLEPTQKTQMNLTFSNIDISEFSPYSIKFAGREIAKGKMDLDLEYEINKSDMKGKNNIVLHDFALGKKVDQPGAADLPLDLAIALLKDKDGVIRANLPVQGNVDDPKFDYGSTIRTAIRQLITNVAAAPFRFLAGLVGVGKNKDLGYISFFAGRTDLSPAQNEKVQQLGEAMVKRPDLQITIAGVYSASFDTQALKEEKFNAKLREQISQNLTDANIGSRKYIATLEKLYEEKNLSPSLAELKRNALNQPDEDNDNMDRLGYVKSVKDALVETEVISQEDLLQLGDDRAKMVYQHLSQIPGVNTAQIKMSGAREGELNKDNKLKLELGADLKKAKTQKTKTTKTASTSTKMP
jgi:hypothetical protein